MKKPPFLAMREAFEGLSQRQVERDLGWFEDHRGRLSLIERGITPTEEEYRQLMAYYGQRMQEAGRG